MAEGGAARYLQFARTAVVAAACGMTWLAVAPCASAAPAPSISVADRAKARRLSQLADAKLARGDVAGALDLYVQSAQVIAAPATLLQVAQLRDKLGEAREAVSAYEAYVDAASTAPAAAKDVAVARARIAALRQTPGHVLLRGTPTEARIVIDGESVFEGFPVEVDLAPGVHLVQLTADGYVPQDVHLDVRFGSSSSPAVDLEPEAKRPPPDILDVGRPEPVHLPAPPPPAPLPPAGPSWASTHQGALVVTGLGVACAAVGVAYGLEALAAQRSFHARASSADADRGERAAFHADVAFGASLLLGAAGVFLMMEDAAPRSASVQVAPFATAAATGLVAQGRF